MRTFLIAVAAVLLAGCVSAQDAAANFDQLRHALKPAEPIVLTAASGNIVRGRVLDISPSVLTLSVDGQRREYVEDDVLKITQRRHGNIGKGAAIGAAIGAGIGMLGIVASHGSDCGQCLTAYLLAFTGVGAAGGAAVAASSSSDHLLFLRVSVRW